jgi:DNA-binding transcriptional MerR regulator
VTEEPEKLFYSISEVAENLKVNQSLLRFWEKEFPGIRPLTNKKGNRMYTRKEVDLIYRIYELVKVKGFTLQGAKDQLKKKNSRVVIEEQPDIKNTLLKIKGLLVDLKNQLD